VFQCSVQNTQGFAQHNSRRIKPVFDFCEKKIRSVAEIYSPFPTGFSAAIFPNFRVLLISYTENPAIFLRATTIPRMPMPNKPAVAAESGTA
jgi:hypothetical protein